MHDRVRDLRKIGLSQQRRVVMFLLSLSGGLLCSGLTAQAKSDYEIINTGIKGGGCWVDDMHFVVEKRVPHQGSDESDLEGLYYVDPNHPKELKRIDLSPLGLNLQKRVHTVSCQEQTIMFYLRNNESELNRIYALKIGAQPELLAEMRGGTVNLMGQYVVGQFRRAGAIEAEGLQGTRIYEAHPDCGVKYVKPGLKTLCLDTWMESGWSGSHYRVVEYKWYETILVRDKNGQEKRVPNPEPPLRLADGTELRHGYLLRDMENGVVQQIKLKQPPYELHHSHLMKMDPQGEHLYASCSKAGDHGDKHYDEGGRVCRFKLDGVSRLWEEVFAVQQSPKELFGLQDLDVNGQDDVVVIHRGRRPQSIWKYTASSRKVEFVTMAPFDLGMPQISPNGWWVSFILRGELHLAHAKGEKP